MDERPVEDGGIICAYPERSIVIVSGGDAATFLHGQLSADVEGLGVGDDVPSLLLYPDGKLCSPLHVLRHGTEEYWLMVPSSLVADVERRLSRFVLRTAATITVRDDLCVVAVRGPGAAALDVPEPRCDPRWPLTEGVDLITDAQRPPAGVVHDEESFEALRIRNGIGEVGSEFDETTIPAVGGRHFIDSRVSFDKGCYVGQELVARVDSRGANTPTKLRILELAGQAERGASVEAGGIEVGSLSSVEGGWALAVLKRSVAAGDTVTVGAAVRVSATVFDVP